MGGPTRTPPAVGDPSGAAAREALNAAALRSERFIAVARIALALAVFARSSAVWLTRGGDDVLRMAVTAPALAIALAFSIYELGWATRGGRPAARLVLMSVSVDALVCFAAFLPNVLWPWEGYTGLLTMPDVAALLVVTFAAGLRLSPRAAVVGTAANTVSYLVLVGIDIEISAYYFPGAGDPFVLYCIYIAGAGALAIALSVQTMRVVERAAGETLRAERARINLTEILRDHHDLRSLITAINLRSEALGNDLEPTAAARVRRSVERIRRDLADCTASLQHIRERALEEVLALETREPVRVDAVAGDVIDVIARRFPGVAVANDTDPAAIAVVAGGEASLRRILFNLLVNACEGDGGRGARTVRLECRREGDTVAIELTDDGPGFATAALAGDPGATTKPDGTGLGLSIAGAVVRASGGELHIADRDQGGARVRVELAAAPDN